MTTQPAKPRAEVREETHETLHVLDQDRLVREDKMRSEDAFFEGADEVRFSERSWQPRRAHDLDAIRAAVDALEVRRLGVASEPAPLPEPPQPASVEVPVRVPDHHRAPLERAVGGPILSVDTLHRLGTSTVVEARWRDPAGESRRGLFVVRDGEARPYDDLASVVDSLPAPALEKPAPAPEAAPAPAPAPEAAPAAAPAPAPEAEPKKGLRGKLPFGGKKEKAQEPPAAAAADTAPAPAPAESAPKKRGFGFGKRAAKEEPTKVPPADPAAPEEKGGKRRFGLRRK